MCLGGSTEWLLRDRAVGTGHAAGALTICPTGHLIRRAPDNPVSVEKASTSTGVWMNAKPDTRPSCAGAGSFVIGAGILVASPPILETCSSPVSGESLARRPEGCKTVAGAWRELVVAYLSADKPRRCRFPALAVFLPRHTEPVRAALKPVAPAGFARRSEERRTPGVLGCGLASELSGTWPAAPSFWRGQGLSEGRGGSVAGLLGWPAYGNLRA